jgi:hypothetical protein
MSNLWEHPNIIAAEALTHMEDALVIQPMCAVDKTSDFTTKANGWKVGDSVSFRTHGEYTVKDFTNVIDVQDITTSSRSMTIEKWFDVSVEVTAREEALDLDSFSEQVIMPAAYALAEKVDTYLGSKILQGAGLYTSNSLYTSAADIALARKAAIIQQLSMNRFSLVDLDLEATLLGQEWFNQAQSRGEAGVNTLQSGIMGRVMGMDWASSIAFPTTTHTAGDGTTTTNNGGGTNNIIGDTTLAVAATTDTFLVGDRIQVAGIRRPLIVAAQADAGATSISLVDPITEIIPDSAAVTVVGSGTVYTIQGAVFDNRSLAVAFPMLDTPGDKIAGTAASNGISIRIVKGYSLTAKKTTLSMDLLVGSFALDPRHITLVANV